MNEHEQPKQQNVEDLDVPREQADDVQGGSLNFTKITFNNVASVPDAPEVSRYGSV